MAEIRCFLVLVVFLPRSTDSTHTRSSADHNTPVPLKEPRHRYQHGTPPERRCTALRALTRSSTDQNHTWAAFWAGHGCVLSIHVPPAEVLRFGGASADQSILGWEKADDRGRCESRFCLEITPHRLRYGDLAAHQDFRAFLDGKEL